MGRIAFDTIQPDGRCVSRCRIEVFKIAVGDLRRRHSDWYDAVRSEVDRILIAAGLHIDGGIDGDCRIAGCFGRDDETLGSRFTAAAVAKKGTRTSMTAATHQLKKSRQQPP